MEVSHIAFHSLVLVQFSRYVPLFNVIFLQVHVVLFFNVTYVQFNYKNLMTNWFWYDCYIHAILCSLVKIVIATFVLNIWLIKVASLWRKIKSNLLWWLVKMFVWLSFWQHGFARNLDWTVGDSENVEGNPVVTLELKDDTYSRAMWDFSFHALYKVVKDLFSSSTTHVFNTTRLRFCYQIMMWFHAFIFAGHTKC